jgi:rare lipoprotein A (peptidoglycan hydrolase)
MKTSNVTHISSPSRLRWMHAAAVFCGVYCSMGALPAYAARTNMIIPPIGTIQSGIASFYKAGKGMTMAHKEWVFNTLVVVKNKENGKEVCVRVKDHGPSVKKRHHGQQRIADLSIAAANMIGLTKQLGLASVTIRVVPECPLKTKTGGGKHDSKNIIRRLAPLFT